MRTIKVWNNSVRKLRNLFRMRFHNRLMLYNTLIFLAVAYVLAFISTQYAMKLNTVTQLQQSRDVLNALHNYYDRKHENFASLLFPLYDVQKNYADISRLMESPTDLEYEDNPFNKQEIVSLMEGISFRDPDISSVLLRKNLTGAQYVYHAGRRTLSTVGDNSPFFNQLKDKKAGRSIYGTRTIEIGPSLSKQVFGIAGTVGTMNIRRDAGQILIAYDTQALQRIYESSSGKTLGRFVIVTVDGQLIYDSEGRYDETFPYMKALHSEAENIKIDGQRYYVQSIGGQSRNYYTANLIPKELLNRSSAHLPLLIFGGVTAVAVLCALLYSVAGSFASRRVMELVRAMKYIGSNNLNYRIREHGKADEFDNLAKRFNTMCDELQEIINREYFTEIRKKNAELKALQAGINPHFLYNTLEAIRIKAFDEGNEEVAEMIVLLASLYRSIVRDNTFISIRKELSLCSMYMSIFSLRYANQLEFEIDVEPQVMEYGVPKNMLQPIIENYFVHGIRGQDESNRFVIRGAMQGKDILFTIDDNGRGISSDRLMKVREALETENVNPSEKSSYGLRNAHERIQLVFGPSYGIQLESEEDNHTTVKILIPAKMCEELASSINELNDDDGTQLGKSHTFS